MADRYGRTVTVRTVGNVTPDASDSVYVCAGDNAIFIANVIALAHAHNVGIDQASARNVCDGI